MEYKDTSSVIVYSPNMLFQVMYYPHLQLSVPGSQGYLVYTPYVPSNRDIWHTFKARFWGVSVSQPAAMLKWIAIIWWYMFSTM